jgi:hypothetical protein
VRALRTALADIKAAEHPLLRSEIERLRKVLDLHSSMDRLANARSILTGEAMARLGDAVTTALVRGRHCSSTGNSWRPGASPET